MTRQQPTSPAAFLQQLIPESELRQKAIALGVVQRTRKVDIVALFTAVILSVSGAKKATIASMRRRFILHFGRHVARSSFWDRFTAPFGKLMAWFLEVLQEEANSRKIKRVGILASFKDVVAIDATVIKLNDSLRDRWAGTRRNSRPAALKVYTLIRVLTGELLKHRITPERFNDNKALGLNWTDAGKLFLVDRGFCSASLWWRIDRVGAFFLTRLPASYEPLVRSENKRHRGRARRLRFKNIRDAAETLKRKIIDVNCGFRAHVRAHGTPRGHYEYPAFRVIGIWNEDKREYHFYVTNVPPERLPAEVITDVYRLRWEVEIFYRTGKGRLGLDELDFTKPHIVETMVLAALIRASVAMRAKLEAEVTLPKWLWINPESWAEVWNDVLPLLLVELIWGHRLYIEWRDLALLAVDPNRGRVPNRVKHRRDFDFGGRLCA